MRKAIVVVLVGMMLALPLDLVFARGGGWGGGGRGGGSGRTGITGVGRGSSRDVGNQKRLAKMRERTKGEDRDSMLDSYKKDRR